MRRQRRLLTWQAWPEWIMGLFSVMLLGGILWHLIDEALVDVIVRLPPGRSACLRWVEHLRAAGYHVWTEEASNLAATREHLGVPNQLAACHTAVTVNGRRYVLEGHVPAEAIGRLLAERPRIRGLAVPGAPPGAPGIEGPGAQPYDVWAFTSDGRTTLFERHLPTSANAVATRADGLPAGWMVALVGLVFACGAAGALVAFPRLTATEREWGPVVFVFRPRRAADPWGLRTRRAIRMLLESKAVQELQPLSRMARSAGCTTTHVGWAVPKRYRDDVARLRPDVQITYLPPRRCSIVEYPLTGILACTVGRLRVRYTLAKHRALHRYAPTELYVTEVAGVTVFAQPIRHDLGNG